VGFRGAPRCQRRISKATGGFEVVGQRWPILTRMLQDDPDCPVVVRLSLTNSTTGPSYADLGLALCLEVDRGAARWTC